MVESPLHVGSYQPPLSAIVNDACAATGIDRHDLLGGRRSARLAHVRFAVVWAARSALNLSHPRIARSLYPRGDHTASLHALRRANTIIPQDPAFARLARQLAVRAAMRAARPYSRHEGSTPARQNPARQQESIPA
jgi:chromosomal replication initiation ATPase DnaA